MRRYQEGMALPRMVRVRQTFARPRVADIPRTVAERLAASNLPVKRGDTAAMMGAIVMSRAPATTAGSRAPRSSARAPT